MEFINNIDKYFEYFPLFLIALVFSFILTPIVIRIAKKLNILDLPEKLRPLNDETKWRRIHTEPKLKLGGIAVILPFLVLSYISIPISRELIGFIIGILLLLGCGILDDIFELSSKIQALFQILASTIIVLSGLKISILSNPLGNAINLQYGQISFLGQHLYILSAIITIIWIFFIINAVKWVSGSDGLVEGNGAIAAIIIGLLSIRFETNQTAIMGFIFAGSLLGFLPYNFYPSKILSGSSGKSVYGFILAVLAIYSGGKLATFILTLSLPILDAIWVILYRIRKHKPKTIFQLFSINDKSHIHHKLLDMGFNQRQVAYIEYSFTLTTGIAAFLLIGVHKIYAILIALIFLIFIYFVISIKISNKRKQ